jgi:hypothetical protein
MNEFTLENNHRRAIVQLIDNIICRESRKGWKFGLGVGGRTGVCEMTTPCAPLIGPFWVEVSGLSGARRGRSVP